MSDHQVLTFGRVVAENQLIWLHCQSCSHGIEILAGAIVPGIPPDTPFPKIVRYLVCRRCGSKAIDVMPEVYPGGFLGARSRFGFEARAVAWRSKTSR